MQIKVLEQWRHEEQVSYERFSMPGDVSHELQISVYPSFVCLAVVDYEDGTICMHADYPR